MQDPAPQKKSRHTCPRCGRPVEPGDTFCESCGTRIPDLPVCSECGTRFKVPVNYCDACGAPVNPGVEPEPEDSAGQAPEKNGIPDEDREPEPFEEEIPEPDELPEDRTKITEPDERGPPPRDKKEIPEPDTGELLEQFGAEYGAGETLASTRKQKPGTVDDPLFFSEGKPKSRAKPRVNTLRIIGGCLVFAVIIAALYFIGLPMLPGFGSNSTHGNQTPAVTNPIPTIVTTTSTAPVTTTRGSGPLVPQPTQVPPGQKLYFQVQKDPVTHRISVIFSGSAGEGSILTAEIKVTHPDGSVSTGIIQPLKGINELTIEGSDQADRVEIIAKMSSGTAYRVYDALAPLVK
jgi:hypothetical protein